MAVGFRLLEHTSDIGVLARGSTREEALVGASLGLGSILVERPYAIRWDEERFIKASGPDEAAQVVDWLNEIVFFFDTEGMVFGWLEIDTWTSNDIVGRVFGMRLDPYRHDYRTAIKAVTYHQFESHPTPKGWEIRVFVDV